MKQIIYYYFGRCGVFVIALCAIAAMKTTLVMTPVGSQPPAFIYVYTIVALLAFLVQGILAFTKPL